MGALFSVKPLMNSSCEPLHNALKAKLDRNELALSMIVRLVRGIEIASIARTAGLDSVYIDLEHNSYSIDTTSQICMACLAVGVTPLVRIPGHDPALIARVLDGGALGIIAPHVESKADAKAIVQAAKYPPIGLRSYAASQPFFHFRPVPAKDAILALNQATMVVAMVESGAAVSSVDDIASVDGIDMLLVGTNDLANDLAIPGELNHPRIREAYATVWQACRKHGKALGIAGLGSQPEFTKELVEMGGRYISIGSDLTILLGGVTDKVKQLRTAAERP